MRGVRPDPDSHVRVRDPGLIVRGTQEVIHARSQALYIERQGSGFVVWYAIADVVAFVNAGGPVDRETQPRRHRPGLLHWAGPAVRPQARPVQAFTRWACSMISHSVVEKAL